MTSTTHVNNMIINNISSQFAEAYRIQGAVITESGIVLSIVKSPQAKNTVVVKIELLSVFDSGDNDVFNALKNTTVEMADIGLPPVGGYPWTPQTSNIPTAYEKAVWNGKMNGGNGYSSGNNVNLITSSGLYATTGDGINLPTAGGDGWATFINLPPMPDNIERSIQLCYKWNDTTSGRSLYFRTVNNGNFSEWSRILHQTDYDKLFTSVSDGKTKVASAISDKGVYTSPVETFDNMANNIRLIQTGPKIVDGTLSTASIPPRSTSADYVTPLVDFEPRYCSTRWGGACIFDYAEIWEGTTAYSDGTHTLRMIKEQVSGKWQIRMRFYNALSYSANPDTVRYRITN